MVGVLFGALLDALIWKECSTSIFFAPTDQASAYYYIRTHRTWIKKTHTHLISKERKLSLIIAFLEYK